MFHLLNPTLFPLHTSKTTNTHTQFAPRPRGYVCGSNSADKIKNYCDSTDPYCCNGNDANSHQQYGTKYGQQALTFVKSKLNASGGGGDGGSQTTPSTPQPTGGNGGGNTGNVSLDLLAVTVRIPMLTELPVRCQVGTVWRFRVARSYLLPERVDLPGFQPVVLSVPVSHGLQKCRPALATGWSSSSRGLRERLFDNTHVAGEVVSCT